MKTSQIKTIDIYTLTWFDRVNGNTYFAQRIILNYGLKNAAVIYNEYQYGYSSYMNFAFDCIRKNGYLKEFGCLYEVELKTKIIFRYNERKALKRELTHISD